MDRFLLFLSLFAAVAAVASHEALYTEVYWNKALPNTPMPGAIKDIIQHVNIRGLGSEAKPGYIAVLEKDMLPGAKFTLHFMRTTSGLDLSFLPRPSADAIPFSSDRLPDILSCLSVPPHSPQAQYVAKTLRECETPASQGETKLCATSLESMLDYVTSSLGTPNVRALSTVIGTEGAPAQKYTIAPSGVRRLAGSGFVACHARRYAYAVYYCHVTKGIAAYEVSLVGADGTEVKAVAACHVEILEPDSASYGNFVRDMTGTSSVCHFLPMDHILWYSN